MEPQPYRATGESQGAAAYPGAGQPATAGQADAERAKDEARRGAQAAKEEFGAVAQQAKQQAGEAGRQVKDAARTAAEQTKRKASEYADQARNRGVAMLDEQRHTAASRLQTVGEAVHRAADKFREDRDENIAGYVEAVADEVDRCARYLEQRDVGSLVRDTQQFARRNPEWFLGGMFFAGLALSRFLKASRPEARSDEYAGAGEREQTGLATMETSAPLSTTPGMPGSAASDATLPIGESSAACGPFDQ